MTYSYPIKDEFWDKLSLKGKLAFQSLNDREQENWIFSISTTDHDGDYIDVDDAVSAFEEEIS